MFKNTLTFIIFFLFIFCSHAQVREIPPEVRDNFGKQYPQAENIRFSDQLVIVYVHFTIDSVKHVATFNNKGEWKETEKTLDYTYLSEDVKDGFEKSKYADWQVEETSVIIKPGAAEEYRIKVSKSDLQKKHLFFNAKGRLKRDAITI